MLYTVSVVAARKGQNTYFKCQNFVYLLFFSTFIKIKAEFAGLPVEKLLCVNEEIMESMHISL